MAVIVALTVYELGPEHVGEAAYRAGKTVLGPIGGVTGGEPAAPRKEDTSVCARYHPGTVGVFLHSWSVHV